MTPFEFLDWPCPAAGGGTREEMAIVFEQFGPHRLLVLPALFDEANKLRRQTVEVMRRLALSRIACVLPDLPGCNESEAPLEAQTLASWREAAAAAAVHFGATHLLAIRAGACIAPPGFPGWSYAATGGRQTLRGLIRARTIAAREAGRSETTDDLQAIGRRDGIELGGWAIGGALFRELEAAEPAAHLIPIAQSDVGGGGLWLRAEPDDAPQQADALAAIVAIGLRGGE